MPNIAKIRTTAEKLEKSAKALREVLEAIEDAAGGDAQSNVKRESNNAKGHAIDITMAVQELKSAVEEGKSMGSTGRRRRR